MYAEILPNVPSLKHSFHYSVPPALAGSVRAGHLVVVPFGKQRVQGVVLAVGAAPPAGVAEFKAVEALLDAEPVPHQDIGGLASQSAQDHIFRVDDMPVPRNIYARGDYRFHVDRHSPCELLSL